MKKLWCVLLAMACFLICLAGCEQQEQVEKKNEFHVSNAMNSNGHFAYRDGYIYFVDTRNIYEYDTETGRTVVLCCTDYYPTALFVSEERVWYTNIGTKGLLYVTRDGKEQGKSFTDTGEPGSWFCCDGEDAYFLARVTEADNSFKVALFHMNWETGATTMLSGDYNVHTYSVDADNIYMVALVAKEGANKDYELFVSARGKIDFRRIDLSFEPVVTCPTTDGLYISNLSKTGNSYLYRGDALEELSVSFGPYYDVVENSLIYENDSTFSHTRSISCRALELYDLETGEKRVLNDSVFEFGVLENRYVCYWWADDVHQKWYYYDLQTGETKLMYEIEDSMTQYGYGID